MSWVRHGVVILLVFASTWAEAQPQPSEAPVPDPVPDAPLPNAPVDEASQGEPEASETSGEVEGAEGTGSPTPGNVPMVVVIDAAPYGIDAVVGQHVTLQMRQTAGELGYDVASAADTLGAAQRLRMPYPPSPADLWRVTFIAQARRGAFARVWAHEGQYVVEISVASLDGSGPFFSRGTAGAEDLHEVVDRLTREALPLPDMWDDDAAARLADQSASPQPVQPVPVVRPNLQPTRVVRRPRRDRRPTRRFDVALQVEGAVGTSGSSFFNFLGGVRLGLRITKTLHLGLYLGYANLPGRDGRANNLLPMLQVENRIRISARSDITVPLRFAVGYLPYNGPVIRLAAGLNVPLSKRVELAFDILTPTFWVLSDQTIVSLSLAAEVIFRL